MMHRSRAPRSLLNPQQSLLPLLTLTALGTFASLAACKDQAKPDPSNTAPSTSSSAATLTTPTVSAHASAEPAKAPPPCTIESTTTIDKGTRGDTGLTVVMLPGNQAAIGYATGEQPKVVVIDTTGKAQHVDIDWGHVRDQEKKKDDKMTRAIHRVTPLGYKGGKMRAGMDVIDTSKEKNTARYLRCGPADLEPIVSDESALNFFEPTEDTVAALPADAADVRDCRTFSNGEVSWVVATEVRRDGTGDNHDLRFSWIVDEVPGKVSIKDPNIDKRVAKPNKDHKYGTLDHFITPVSVNAGNDGYMMVSRDGGGLVFARRSDKFERTGGPWPMWLAAGPGLPSLTHQGERVFLAVGELNKTDLFASTFMGGANPVKPEKIQLTDTSPPTEGARDWPSLSVGSDGMLFVAFIDGKANRRVRLTVLGPELKQKTSDVFDVTGADVNPTEARVIGIAANKALVVWIDKHADLTGAVVSCKY
jgi:hypothetical protein